MRSVFLFLFSIVLFACNNGEKQSHHPAENTAISKPKYAKYFEIEKRGEDRLLRIFNPWKKDQVIQELLFSKSKKEGAVLLPVNSVVPMSTSFYGFIQKLNESATISGVENKDYVYDSVLKERLLTGDLEELGQSGNISVERTVMLHPQMIVISGTEIMGPNLTKIKESGIAILNDMDWQEQHPLGRAEWIKVFGLLYDKEAVADSLFKEIESNYLNVAEKVKNQIPAERTSVLLGYNYQGTWFLPGGRSYVAQYLRDAGANYKYDTDTATGSNGLSSELVFNDFAKADVWLHPGVCKSKAELLRLDQRYTYLDAFKKARIYNNTARSNKEGGNDFWENSPANPDIVLADLVKIFYPQLLPEHKLYFYQRLE